MGIIHGDLDLTESRKYKTAMTQLRTRSYTLAIEHRPKLKNIAADFVVYSKRNMLLT